MLDSTLADPMLMRAAFFENHEDYDNAIAEYDEAIQTDSSVQAIYLFRGSCLKEIREYELAEEDYNTYKKNNPNDKDVNYLVAELYLAKGDFNAAAQLMSQMETTGESAYELYLLRGIAYNDNGQYDDAMTDFNKAENFKDRDARLFRNRGICYYNKKEYRKAKYDFERAVYMEADNMENHYLRCQAAYQAGFYDEACESCKTAAFHGYEGIDKMYMKGCK
jgi:tetratricopeptide (TPR) repeat protein